jgi:hypothetical protein
VRDQAVTTSSGQVIVRCDAQRATLETPSATAELMPDELLLTIEALSMAYATLCGGRPDSAARGVKRTLHNRTQGRGQRTSDHNGGEAA